MPGAVCWGTSCANPARNESRKLTKKTARTGFVIFIKLRSPADEANTKFSSLRQWAVLELPIHRSPTKNEIAPSNPGVVSSESGRVSQLMPGIRGAPFTFTIGQGRNTDAVIREFRRI